MKKLIILVVFAMVATQAIAARIDYTYIGQDTLDQVINFEGADLNDLLVNPPSTGTIKEIGTLFILSIAPWGCYESHVPILSDNTMKSTLEGKGLDYDGNLVNFTINQQLTAKLVPFLVVDDKKYFFNTSLVDGFLNGLAMTMADGQNYDLDLNQVITNFTLTVAVQGQGTVNIDPDREMYEFNSEVVLTALPAAGWQFDGWITTGAFSTIGNDGELNIIMTGNCTVFAKFSFITNPEPFNADVNRDGLINAIDVQLVVNAALGIDINST